MKPGGKTFRHNNIKKGPGFVKKMFARRAKAIAEGKKPPCECWDCLREAGFTPPLGLRQHHGRKYPHQLFEEDVRGEPFVTHNKKTEHDGEITGTEGRHLREAIRNRSAI